MIIANSIYYGNNPADRVYLGDNLIYQREGTPNGMIVGQWDVNASTKPKIKYNGVWHENLPMDENGYFVFNSEQPATNCAEMFRECRDLISIDLSNFDTSQVTDIHQMFSNCSNLESLDVSGLDFSNVTTVSYNGVGDWRGAFSECCKEGGTINVSGMRTKATDLSQLFYSSKASAIILDNFDTSNATDISEMFENCRNLTSLDLSSFDTSNVTDMSEMFAKCFSLTSLDLSNFDTSKVTDMGNMFQYCYKLTFLDLSNWDFGNVTNARYMFEINFSINRSVLTTVIGPISGIKVDLDLKSCPLTNASAMVFVNGLVDVGATRTITFKATTYDTLTEEQIAVATSKGWTVAKS